MCQRLTESQGTEAGIPLILGLTLDIVTPVLTLASIEWYRLAYLTYFVEKTGEKATGLTEKQLKKPWMSERTETKRFISVDQRGFIQQSLQIQNLSKENKEN